MGWIVFIIIIAVVGWFLNSLSSSGSRYASKPETEEEKEANREKHEEEKRNEEELYQEILKKYDGYITRFCEISEREVSFKDEWGDENWKALPKLKKECIERIARQMGINEDTFDDWFNLPSKYNKKLELYDWRTPYWVEKLFSSDLEKRFKEYHDKRKEDYVENNPDVSSMTGEEFEKYLMSILDLKGFSTSGTPKTGDQGADVIASKGGKTYVIQAKRHSKPIGNKAVQEVVAARNYYKGDIGVVVTNSSFTPSAKSLAGRNDIVLINGKEIPLIANILKA